ncbi:MAG: hypothetical protein EPN97_04390 [Alphaproteobacteria bacterium]|nr:MAG: hypothetical protein EPN97_04390 [Alphaproteobacteria bacterium]
MSDPAIERQTKMIEAGDKGDFDAVNQLLAEDKFLHSFGNYLNSMMRHGADAVEKSLSLPNLDRSSAVFESMVSNLVVNAAANGDARMLEVMLKHSRKPADDSDRALKTLFNKLAEKRNAEMPSRQVGLLLLKNGAHLDEALAQPESRFAEKQAELEQLRAQVEEFRQRLAPTPVAAAADTGLESLPTEPKPEPGRLQKLLSKLPKIPKIRFKR